MIVFVRFPPEAGFAPAAIEEVVQGCIGRAGSVIGASDSAIDVEIAYQRRHPDPGSPGRRATRPRSAA